jgi:hypothetical protein
VNERFSSLIKRRPWLVTTVSALLGLIVVDGSRRSGAAGDLRMWPAYVTVGVVAYATVAFFLSFKLQSFAGAQPELVRWALAWAPVVGATFVPLADGPEWIAWLGLAASWLLLVALAASTSRTHNRG